MSVRFRWPEGRDCAVTLAYDDGKPSQLNTALPVLDRLGLRASFFLTGDWLEEEELPRWRRALAQGHELAGHGMRHACGRASGAGWLAPGDLLEAYDLSRMAVELDENLRLLRGLGAQEPYTFAYPCGESWVGPEKESYQPLVRARFYAARGPAAEVAADPLSVDLHQVPSVPAHLFDLPQSLERALESGSWLVLLFHGVGADNSPVAAEEHRRFLESLAVEERAWTVPFKEAAAWVSARRADAASKWREHA